MARLGSGRGCRGTPDAARLDRWLMRASRKKATALARAECVPAKSSFRAVVIAWAGRIVWR